jgi:hypothetical protein
LVGQKVGRVAWVIAQFEEIFTLCNDEKERAAFLANLLYAASIPDGPCTVVLTMRADFLPKCTAFPDLAARIAAQQFLVSPMDTDMLRQAIEAPARRVGLSFEPGLADDILSGIASEPGALPLLEHALFELWKRRKDDRLTLAGYRESGGVKGALAETAEETFKGLSPNDQVLVRRIMLRLTQLGEGTEDTRRRATMDELRNAPEEAESIERIVRAMADARLLTTSGECDPKMPERYVDVSHEALIRGWPRLRRWLDEDRAGLRLHRRITEAAEEWQRSNRDDELLYRGTRLAQAQEWRERKEAELNPLEREYLEASVALKRRLEQQEKERQQRELEAARKLAETERQRAEGEIRARRRQGFFIIGLVVLVLLAGVVTVFAVRQYISAREAESSSRAAESRAHWQQAVLARDRENDAVRATHEFLLAARVAEQAGDQLGCRNILLAAETTGGHLRRSFPHGKSVSGVALSRDRTRLLTWSEQEGLVKLWNLAFSEPIQTFSKRMCKARA